MNPKLTFLKVIFVIRIILISYLYFPFDLYMGDSDEKFTSCPLTNLKFRSFIQVLFKNISEHLEFAKLKVKFILRSFFYSKMSELLNFMCFQGSFTYTF